MSTVETGARDATARNRAAVTGTARRLPLSGGALVDVAFQDLGIGGREVPHLPLHGQLVLDALALTTGGALETEDETRDRLLDERHLVEAVPEVGEELRLVRLGPGRARLDQTVPVGFELGKQCHAEALLPRRSSEG